MNDVFHKAARDGYLDLLREATRKECNKEDEDGMTPTLWAAYYGNLDALRMIVGRGGNPDKCDYLGNSCLHHAASNGHMNCVSFLVSFGANLWALDNNYNTALDIAGLNNKQEIVKYLDTVYSKQAMLNKKIVKKLKDKSVLSAQKRVKEYQKLQEKAQKKAMKTDLKLAKESGMVNGNGRLKDGHKPSSMTPTKQLSISSRKTVGSEPKPYSAHLTISSQHKKFLLSGVAKRIKQKQDKLPDYDFKIGEVEMDGRRTMKSLPGLKRDHHVLYVKHNKPSSNGTGSVSSNSSSSDSGGKLHPVGKHRTNPDNLSRAISEPDFFYSGEDSGVGESMSTVNYESSNTVNYESSNSIFERPGFGSVSFINKNYTTGVLMSLPTETMDDSKIHLKSDEPDYQVPSTSKEHVPYIETPSSRQHLEEVTSIGTVGSLAMRIQQLPWDVEELNISDDEASSSFSPQLEMFLTCNGLANYFSMFAREKIDLDTLLLLNSQDLKDLGMPMGPRKKLLDALARRRMALNRPRIMEDSYL